MTDWTQPTSDLRQDSTDVVFEGAWNGYIRTASCICDCSRDQFFVARSRNLDDQELHEGLQDTKVFTGTMKSLRTLLLVLR